MAQSKGKGIGKIVGLVLMVAGGIAVLLYEPPEEELPPPPNERPAKLLKVETTAQSIERSYSGVVRAPDRVDLAFRVSGPLVEIPVERGELVEEGALVAQVDPRDFQVALNRITARVDEAKARLAAMKAGERAEVIARLENKVTAATADFKNAEIELNRMQDLLDKEVVSQSEFDQAKLRYDTAKEAMRAAEQELAQGRKGARQEDIDAQEATIRGLEAQRSEAANALADTTLEAPFEGLVAKQYVENFEKIKAGQPIVSLQSYGTIEIVADVPESVIAVTRARHIQKIEAVFESLPERVFEVELKEIETEADERTQTYAVTVEMDTPEDVRLLPGMPAMVRFYVSLSDEGATGFVVPVSSILSDESGATSVWRVDPEDRTVTQVPVKVGDMSGDQILVLEGIESGETIVTAGVHSIRQGMKVYPFVIQSEQK